MILGSEAAAPKFGLPRSLQIPIAARSERAIEDFVGPIVGRRLGRTGLPMALLVRGAYGPRSEDDVPLWTSDLGAVASRQLHPELEVWVDVDYRLYRFAYLAFGLGLPAGFVLDHVQNRRAIRQRHRSHPWLRLCPVRSRTNTNAGVISGGEGMENEFVRTHLGDIEAKPQDEMIYADPFDLTKMLDVFPGTGVLDGVRDTQPLFWKRA
ncbi:MAG TPA: hypothetical protein VN773_02245 [Verrucomicrobiae bacterium]|nr:hypothetical protein [Verrucomicrobiae bacterium]